MAKSRGRRKAFPPNGRMAPTAEGGRGTADASVPFLFQNLSGAHGSTRLGCWSDNGRLNAGLGRSRSSTGAAAACWAVRTGAPALDAARRLEAVRLVLDAIDTAALAGLD
jgi:hypothetical protein